MGDNMKFPLRLTTPTEELKRLIAEHPDYPIVVLASEDANCGDWTWMYCTKVSFGVSEILNCEVPCKDDRVYDDRDDFEEDMEDWLWEKLGCPNETQIPEAEFQKQLQEEIQKYEPYWTDVIAIWVDN